MPDKKRGFTLVEMLAVVLILAVLAAVAVPRFYDYRGDAEEAADIASLAGIRTALHLAYVQHRADDAPAAQWVTSVGQIEDMMLTGELPAGIIEGITVSGGKLQDRRGNTYTLTPETATSSAKLELDSVPDPTFS